MPNWCENNLTLSGDADVIKKIRDWYDQSGKTDDVGLFSLFYPLPSELKDTTAPSSEPNWYDWQTTEWGTKWDAKNVMIEGEDGDENEEFLWLSFETPWAPPIKFYEKITKDYPQIVVHANYYEPGFDFAGTFDSKGGYNNLTISGVREECLTIYKDTYKDFVSKDAFEQRLKKIYKNNSPLRHDLCFSQLFDNFYFEESLEDADFCEKYKIKRENQ